MSSLSWPDDFVDKVICGDAIDVLRQIPDNCVDAVVTDPPYGIGIDTWDKPPDITAFTEQVKRVAKEFYAIFGQMPSLANWHFAAVQQGFSFLEHVVWIKRQILPNARLLRGHESICIYAVGKRKRFYQTEGRYEDIKLPGLFTGAVSIEALDRYIKDLQVKISRGRASEIRRSSKRQRNFAHFSGMRQDRSPEFANFTNVWSFFPPSCAKKDGQYLHPTEKPLAIMERLVEMLTPESASVLDPFLGSGTTALACKRLGQRFIGIDISEEYCAIARARLAAVLL